MQKLETLTGAALMSMMPLPATRMMVETHLLCVCATPWAKRTPTSKVRLDELFRRKDEDSL